MVSKCIVMAIPIKIDFKLMYCYGHTIKIDFKLILINTIIYLYYDNRCCKHLILSKYVYYKQSYDDYTFQNHALISVQIALTSH